jgi:uncharacterized protein HemX
MADYKAQKGNVQLSLANESEAKAYQAQGYDIYLGGEVVMHGRGKTVPYEQHAAALAQIEALRESNDELMAQDDKGLKADAKAAKDALAEAQKELTAKDKQLIELQGQVDALTAKVEELEAEDEFK